MQNEETRVAYGLQKDPYEWMQKLLKDKFADKALTFIADQFHSLSKKDEMISDDDQKIMQLIFKCLMYSTAFIKTTETERRRLEKFEEIGVACSIMHDKQILNGETKKSLFVYKDWIIHMYGHTELLPMKKKMKVLLGEIRSSDVREILGKPEVRNLRMCETFMATMFFCLFRSIFMGTEDECRKVLYWFYELAAQQVATDAYKYEWAFQFMTMHDILTYSTWKTPTPKHNGVQLDVSIFF